MSRKRRPSKRASSHPPSKHTRKTQKQNRTWMWVGLGLAALVVLAAATLLLPETTQATEISTGQAYQKYQQGAFFLDVRSQAEWDQAHIAHSAHIPLDELQIRLGELPQDRDIVVVCLTGQRSKEGMTILQAAGFGRASCMTGGLAAWKAAGYPLESSGG